MEMLDMFGENLRSRKKLLGLLLLFEISVGLTLSAESKKPQPAHPNQVAPVSSKASHDVIRVTINSSTAKIIEGAVYGVNAKLENISNDPVSVDIDQIQLAVQPELAPSHISCTWFYEAGTNTAIKSPAVLLPGDDITVFFDTGQKSDLEGLHKLPTCEVTRWGIVRKQLDFVPGDFAFVVSGTYTTQASVSSNTPSPAGSEQHYFTERANLPVTIDQAQMILYAAIGGLLAFLVMSLRNADTLWEYAGKATSSESGHWRRFMVIVRGAGAAILLSSTVTVVAGRLSTTTFPVRVSVDDFWGALTIGFVSFFIGGKFIDKLSETLGPKPQPEGSVPPAAKAAPPAVPAPAGPNASPPAAPA